MDTLQLSIDSFSRSWLPCKKPTSDSPGDSLRFSVDASRDGGGSFIEMDPKAVLPVPRKSTSQDFDFSLPSSDQAAPPAMVNADQVFRNGLMLPLQLVNAPPKREEEVGNPSDSILMRSLSVDSSKSLLSASKRRRQGRCTCRAISLESSPSHGVVVMALPSSSRKKKKKKKKKKLDFFKGCAKSSKNFVRKYLRFLSPLYKKVKGFGFTRSTSKRSCTGSTATATASSVNKMDDASRESAIRDAILHCKNSIKKS